MESNSTKFDCQSVLFYYGQIQSGRTRAEKDEANTFIVQFIASDQAWPIALELLQAKDNQQSHFIGAQALFQKLDRDYEQELGTKDSHVIELRDKLFGLLNGEEGQPTFNKLVIERLCMSLSYIALYSTNTCWQTSIFDIICYGSRWGPSQCFISLSILKNICITFDNKMFDQKQTAMIKRMFRENVASVFEFCNKILSTGSFPHEIYLGCLSVIKHWSNYSRKTFIVNEPLVATLLHLLANDGSIQIFKKCVNVMKKMLTISDHVKITANMKFHQAIQPNAIPEKDLGFLRHLVDYLYANKEKYQQCTNEMYTIDDDQDESAEKAIFAQKYTQLMMAICMNYEVLFITPHNVEWGQKMYQIIMIGSRAKNLNIVVQTTEFWPELKQSLQDCIQKDIGQVLQEIDSQTDFCSPFLQACEILTQQSEMLSSDFLTEISEDDQEEQRGMLTRNFRQIIEDVYLQSYFLLTMAYQENGAKKFYLMFLQKLENSKSNVLAIESCLFMLKSIEVALKDDGFQSAIMFVKEVVGKLLDVQDQFCQQLIDQKNVLLKKGFCELIHEIASFFTKFPEYLGQTLNLVLSLKDSLVFVQSQSTQQALETLYSQTIMELCLHCPQFFTQNEFVILKTHLTQNAQTMSMKNVSSLMESVCYVCTKQGNEQALKVALNDICYIPLSFLEQIQEIQTVEKDHLLKALSMITGAVKAQSELDEEILITTLLPMIESVWKKLMSILQFRSNENELVITVCLLIQKFLASLSHKLESNQFFDNLSNDLINSFKSNPKNICCLQTFSFLCIKMGKSSDEIQQLAMIKFEQISESVLLLATKLQEMDVDLLREFADILLRWAEVNLAYLISSKYFNDSLLLFSATLEKVDSKDLNTQLVRFFSYLLNTVSIKFRRLSPDVLTCFMNYYGLILRSLMLTLTKSDINKDLGTIAEAFKNAINWAEQGGIEEKLRQEFVAIAAEVLKNTVSQKLQETVVNIIFGLRYDQKKIRLCLLNLHSHIMKGYKPGQSGGEEAFLGLELQAQEAKTKTEVKQHRVEILD